MHFWAPADLPTDAYPTQYASAAALSVTNGGEPIPLGTQQVMFQPFLSGRAGEPDHRLDGTGLGLTFCKLAIEAHGGSIRVESPCPGAADGARIVIALPAGRPAALQPRLTP